MYFWKYILAKKAGLSQQKCNMALYGLPVLPIAEAFEKTVTGNPISVTDALAQDALSLQVAFQPTQDGTPSIDSEATTEPYLSKVIPRGNKEYYSLVGATVAWNQLVQITDFVSVTYGGITGTNNGNGTYTVNGRARDLFDVYRNYELTANHVYFAMGCPQGGDPYTYRLALASKTDIGSGLIYKSEYGGNETLAIRISNGTEVNNLVFRPQLFDLTLMFANNPAIADYVYTLEQSEAGSGIAWLKSYGFFTKDYYPYNPGELISVNTSGHKIGSTTYPIDNIDLRGLFKLSNGKLYCEGDAYKPDGTVPRNFEYRAYQSGDESLADAITDGTHTVVKLATPTTESATPYTSPIDVEAGGTEEFVDNRTVPIPVGNETYYASEYEVHGKTGVAVSHGATEDDPNPTEYEVEFTSQGTVYGGTVDIVSGVLSVNYGRVDMGSLNWRRYKFGGIYAFFANLPDRVPAPNGQKCYCSKYNKNTTGIGIAWLTNKTMAVNSNTTYIYIRDDSYTDENSFKTALNGMALVYELAEPQTYQLTTQQVQMLLGDNYLETPDGTITITYMAGR